jgi:hypothetical protein
MKGINELDKISQARSLATGSKDTVSNGLDGDLFKKTFDKILSSSDEMEPAAGSPAVSGLGEIPSFNLKIEDSSVGDVEKSTDQLLTMLEQFAKDLSDPSKSLKDIEPLIQGIKENADLLSSSVKNDSESGKALKTIAEQSSVLANVEYMKFMRGDYV